MRGELVRPGAPRPTHGRDDVEWWWAVVDDFRPLHYDELGRKCSIASCPNEAWLVRMTSITRWESGRTFTRREFRCPDHVYGNVNGNVIVEEGRVLAPAPNLEQLR